MSETSKLVALGVKTFIDNHYMETHNLSEYSRVSGYSKFYTARMFKEEMQLSIGEYLQKVRLEKMKEFLLTTDKPFYEIVYDVGYQSVGGTFMLFRQKVGCSPKEFRQAHVA